MQIEEAACGIALKSGLFAVTLRAVAAEVGVTPALVAHYEPNMEDLTVRTFASIVSDELEEVRRLVATEDSEGARLTLLLQTLLEPRRTDVTLVWMQAWALGRRSDALAQSVREQLDGWEALIAELIDAVEGVSGTEGVAGSRLLARQVLGVIGGLNSHSLVDWHDNQDQLALLTHSVEALLRMPVGALSSDQHRPARNHEAT